MEKRKITSLGKYSLVVTLPKNWIKMNKLEGGDQISLEILDDGSLLIHTNGEEKERQTQITLQINANEEIDMTQRRIIGCYLNGYDKIILKSVKNFTKEQQDGIRTIVRSLYMRIFESHAHQVTLQAFMDESLASVTSGVERMQIITVSMAKDVLNAMKNWDIELARSVISLEEDVDQFLFFLTRLLRTTMHNPSLASKLGVTMGDCFDYHLLVNRIEYVADCLRDIADALIKLYETREKVSDEFMGNLLEMASWATHFFDLAVDGFMSTNLEHVGDIINYAEEAIKNNRIIETLHYYGNSEKQVLILCHTMIENFLRILTYAADIAEITIDRHYVQTKNDTTQENP